MAGWLTQVGTGATGMLGTINYFTVDLKYTSDRKLGHTSTVITACIFQATRDGEIHRRLKKRRKMPKLKNRVKESWYQVKDPVPILVPIQVKGHPVVPTMVPVHRWSLVYSLGQIVQGIVVYIHV